MLKLLLCGAAFSPAVVTAQPSLPRFRELLSSPPAIEEILAERRYEGSKPPDFYFGRWQSNAFLLSISTNAEHVKVGGTKTSLAQVFARSDDLLWQVFGVNRPLKIGVLNSVGPRSELMVGTYWASVDLGRLLNCGIDHLKPGQVRWAGTSFSGTNESGSAVVTGEAVTNARGQVVQLTMNIVASPDRPSATPPAAKTHHWEIEYQFTNSISDLYPSVMKRYVLRDGRRFLRDEIHVHSIRLAKGVMSPELFAYEPFVISNSLILRATNNAFYQTASNGVVRAVSVAPGAPPIIRPPPAKPSP
jgi:hypothetical protein